MVRTVAGAVVGIMLLAGSAYAVDKPKIEPVLGEISSTSIGKSFTQYCVPTNTVYVKEKTLIPVVGITTCRPSYLDPEPLYEVAYRGQIYYATLGSIKLEGKEAQRLKDMPSEDLAVFKKATLAYTKLKWLESVGDAMKELEKAKSQGIAILDAEIFDTSEYTEGTGFKIRLYNPTKKVIKYVTVNYVGFNAVKDPVKDYRSKSKNLTLRAVGPIEPGAPASYSQDYAWMTDLVETFNITSIKVEYMDGTKKVIKEPAKVRIPRWMTALLDDYFSGRYDEDKGGGSSYADGVVAAPAAK